MEKKEFQLGFASKSVPGGTHIAVLYEKEAELIELFSRYFAEGLKDNEICVVVYKDVGFRNKMEEEVSKIFPKENQSHNLCVEYVHYEEFYLDDDRFDSSKPIGLTDKKLLDKRHLEGAGIRTMGVMSWVSDKDFDDVIRYEKVLTERYFKENLIISCAYPTKNITIPHIIKILQSHTLVLYKEDDIWKMSETVERNRMQKEIDGLEQFTKLAIDRELKMTELKEKLRKLEEKRA
jgi:hypothetical protein